MRYNDWEMNVISVGYTSNERRTLLNAAHDYGYDIHVDVEK